jgi:hypothetical protein
MTDRATSPDDMTEARIIRRHGSRILWAPPTKDCWCSDANSTAAAASLIFHLTGAVILRYVP